MDIADYWQEYALLQQRTDRPKINAQTWAFEEQTNEFLTAIANQNVITDAPTRSKIVKNLGINRRRKHLHRQFLMNANSTLIYPPPPDTEAALITSITIAFLRCIANPHEWHLLELIAMGTDYRAIAATEQRTVSGIKSTVSRCRSRLRKALNK